MWKSWDIMKTLNLWATTEKNWTNKLTADAQNNTKIDMFLSKNINSIVMAPSGNELEEISKNLKEHNTRKRADVTVLVSDKKIDFKLKKDIHSDLKSN